VTETRSIGEILRDAAAGRLAESRDNYDFAGGAERLFSLLDGRGIDFALVGGLAVVQYIPGRNTLDIDLLLAPSALKLLPELDVSSRDKNFARAVFEGIQIDLLLTANKLFELVLRGHVRLAEVGDRSMKVATTQGLLLLKLFALPSLYRQGESFKAAIYESDVVGLLQAPGVDVEAAFRQLEPHLLNTDIVELRRLIEELRGRQDRFSAP
jgi:hypothetical protein